MNKFWIYNIVFLFLLAGFDSSAQLLSTSKKSAQKAYAEARDKYFTRQYDEAIDLLDKAIKKDKSFSEAYWFKATIYEINRQYDKQINALKAADNPSYTYYDETLIKLGTALFNEGRYSEAKDIYNTLEKYGARNSNLVQYARYNQRRCDFALNLVAHPEPFQPENLGPEVNTEYDDYWPVISADENRLITTVLVETKRGNLTEYQEDFYESYRKDSGWSKSVPLAAPLNSPNNEGAQSLSPDGEILFFSACNRAEGSGKCDIFISFHTASGWSEPVNPGSPLNTTYWEAHPSMSSDGHTLYFCSNRPGGYGKRDIWIANLEISADRQIKIVEVKNAGPVINTEEDEVSPYIHFDDQTLYFSSDGHMGLGRHDIFMSRKDSAGEWQEPENIGYPINSHRDEIGFTVNALGTRAYYASEAFSGERKDKDIYAIPLPQKFQPIPVTYFKGNIYNADNNKALVAEFELTDLEEGRQVSKAHSAEDGTFLLCLPVGRNYALNVSKEGYMFYSDRFTLSEQQDFTEPVNKDIPLQPMKAGTKIELKNIYFEFDSYALKKESFIELNKLVALLKNNPSVIIEIGGHTDGKGTDEYNRELSQNRAESVKEYLINNGIKPERLQTKGYGFSQPLDKENPYDGINRRTELKIISM
ncbi:OmpA family protein [Saccharicrinis sp. FJH54]|uniref:OmpA family protein n=1 Tax=Saccharicrinis sp. FJH54 TaxID=3344665 RepID=UPI0035D45E12